MKLLFPLLTSMLPAASVAQSQLPSPKPNNFNLPFVLSVIGAFIASFVLAMLYVWPRRLDSRAGRREIPCEILKETPHRFLVRLGEVFQYRPISPPDPQVFAGLDLSAVKDCILRFKY